MAIVPNNVTNSYKLLKSAFTFDNLIIFRQAWPIQKGACC